MANKGMIEGMVDASARVKAKINNATPHKINLGEKHGTAKSSDFDPAGIETPAKVDRARVDPSIAAKQRRAGLIDVTPVVSPSGHSHIFEPPPSKL
jgi:hypothetical protein